MAKSVSEASSNENIRVDPSPRESDEIVLQALARSKAASLIELMSLVDLPDDQVEESVTRLQQQALVSVSNNDDKLNRIVSIRDRGLRAAR